MDRHVMMPEALVKLVQTLAHSDAVEPIVAALQLIFIAIVYAHKWDNVLHKDRETWQNSP